MSKDVRRARFDLMVPVAKELVASDSELSEFLIGHLDASRIGISIQLSLHLESSVSGGSRMRFTMVWKLRKGLPRQFWLISENSRCSILFHLLVPGGK